MDIFPARRILVAVDFSPLARAAWSWARSLAAPDARVEVLYVHEAPPTPVFGLPAPFLAPAHRRSLLKRLQAAYPGAEARVAEGSVALEILRASRKSDLVVMGCHGRKGLERAVLGSVSESVVNAAAVPVLVVRTTARRVKSVLAPVNMMPYSRKGLRAAAEVSKHLGAELTALYVDRDPYAGSNARFLLSCLLDRLPAGLKDAFAWKILQRGGEAIPAILGESDKHGLVVMTAHRKPLLEDVVLGSTAERVLRHCRVPVLTVPSGRGLSLF